MHDPNKPPPKVGSEAFGDDSDGKPKGSEAFGGFEKDAPLKGALLFGNDPEGNPRGSEAFGGFEKDVPLKGALLFGNDPQGEPRGSEIFGGFEKDVPLKGALLFGNDPQGQGRGSEAVGQADLQFPFRGSFAFGAPQLMPERLYRDEISYDFVGKLMRADDSSLAGMRPDPNDRVRERVLACLQRYLGMDQERLRSGLSEHSIPWGKLRPKDAPFDRALAEALREGHGRAPGSVLGVGHVQSILEGSERMHTFELHCDWDVRPWRASVLWGKQSIAFAESSVHKEHSFFVLVDPKGQRTGYVDALVPHRGAQEARMRTVDAEVVAVLRLTAPAPNVMPDGGVDQGRFCASVEDPHGEVLFTLAEQRATPQFFRAELTHPISGEVVGRIEDRLNGGKIRTLVELDLRVPRMVAWGTALMMADLARLRRGGWPKTLEEATQHLEPIEAALGPRRRRKLPR